jgi:hypothetical protein
MGKLMQKSRNGNKVSVSVKCWKKITQPPRSTNIPMLQIYGTFLKNPSAAIFFTQGSTKKPSQKKCKIRMQKISCKAKVPNLKSSTTQTQAVNKALGSGFEVLVPNCTSKLPFGLSQNKLFRRKKNM